MRHPVNKIQAIEDLEFALVGIALHIGEQPPKVEPHVWYNIPREHIDRLTEFFELLQDKLKGVPHAMDG